MSDIQDYFLKMIQKHESTIKNNEESPTLIYPNEVKNRIVFKIKTGYKLELLTKETQKLLGDGPLVDKNKNSKNVPQLDQVQYVLLHCNLVQNDYLQNSKLLYEFVPVKKFGQLISVKPPVFNVKHQILFLITLKFGLLIRIIDLYKLKIKCQLLRLFKIIDFNLLNFKKQCHIEQIIRLEDM